MVAGVCIIGRNFGMSSNGLWIFGKPWARAGFADCGRMDWYVASSILPRFCRFRKYLWTLLNLVGVRSSLIIRTRLRSENNFCIDVSMSTRLTMTTPSPLSDFKTTFQFSSRRSFMDWIFLLSSHLLRLAVRCNFSDLVINRELFG